MHSAPTGNLAHEEVSQVHMLSRRSVISSIGRSVSLSERNLFMHYRPFRFGVATGSAHSRAEWVSRARRAEELGYATLVVADHLTTGLAPLSALAVAAEATTSLRIGSLVFCNDFRHPALLAREAARDHSK